MDVFSCFLKVGTEEFSRCLRWALLCVVAFSINVGFSLFVRSIGFFSMTLSCSFYGVKWLSFICLHCGYGNVKYG